MKALVSGAAGFVGRATCAALRARGDTVRALVARDDGPAAARLARLGVERVVCDPGADDAAGAIARAAQGVDTIVHAHELRATARATMAQYEREHVVATENVLDAARAAGVRRVVHVSTEAVTAGHHARDYVDEDFPHADVFTGPYAETRALAEALVLAANHPGATTTCALRPGCLWGPDDDELLPELIARVRARSLVLYDHGKAMAPTTYVDNLVDIVLRASASDAAAGSVYYATDDERITWRAFLTRVLGAVGLGVPRRDAPYPVAYALAWAAEKLGRTPGPGAFSRAEVVRFGRVALFNAKRVREQLGWEPVVGVDEGARRLARWANAVGGADAIVRGDVLEPRPEA